MAPASAARSSPAHGRAACAAAEADLPPPRPRSLLASVGLGRRQPSASSRPPAPRQLRPPREVARTGTNGGSPRADPEAFSAANLKRAGGGVTPEVIARRR